MVVNAHFAFRIRNAGQDTFRVFFPEGEGAEPVLVAERQRSVSWEDVELPDGRKGRMLTIVLQQAVEGLYQFRLAYEKRLDMADGEVVRGDVTVRGPEPQGENAAVGAGSVVVNDIPPYTVVAGNPATVIRHLDMPDGSNSDSL